MGCPANLGDPAHTSSQCEFAPITSNQCEDAPAYPHSIRDLANHKLT